MVLLSDGGVKQKLAEEDQVLQPDRAVLVKIGARGY